MPGYVYDSCVCDTPGEVVEMNVPIAERDNQFCVQCGQQFKRKIAFIGPVWAPTAGGMR